MKKVDSGQWTVVRKKDVGTQNETRENMMIRQGKKAFFVTCNLFSATCLALLLAPSSAQAQACAGTNVTATGSSVVIDCVDNETVITASRLGPSHNDIDTIAATIDGDGPVQIGVSGGGSSAGVIGWLDFSALDGDLDLNIEDGSRGLFFSGSGATGPVSTHFGNGNVNLHIAEGAKLSAFGQPEEATTANALNSQHRAGIDQPVILDFGDGGNSLLNEGVLIVGYKGTQASGDRINIVRTAVQGELHLLNLGQFQNAGLIRLGSRDQDRIEESQSGGPPSSDYWHDDILLMPGADFVGLPGSRIEIDVNLNGGFSQTACDPALRLSSADSAHAAGADMPGADCVGLQGGSTSGETRLLVRDVFSGDRGGNVRTVLIDVSGGDSAAEHFVLDPESDSYNSRYGGVIDKGLFVYPLVYDADAQQHLLVAAPGPNALQMPLLAQAAHDLWRVSTAGWTDRQADLRAAGPAAVAEGVGGGVWLRAAGEIVDRDARQTAAAGPGTLEFNNDFRQHSQAYSFGLDLISGYDGDRAWMLGLTAGYAHSKLGFDHSPNAHRLDGFTGGVYGGFLAGDLFVDAMLNINDLSLHADMPALGLSPEGTRTSTELLSLGLHVDAGWRLDLERGFFVEPLAGLSWVRSDWDDLDIVPDDPLRAGVGVEFDDPESLRIGLGGRVGLDRDLAGWRTQLSLLGRYWNESEGKTAVILRSTGPDAVVRDDRTGGVTELGLGLSVYSDSGAVSGFLNLGHRRGDDDSADTVTAGVRVAW